MPKFFIKTYGCQMNERDSEQVAHSLIARGYERVESEIGSRRRVTQHVQRARHGRPEGARKNGDARAHGKRTAESCFRFSGMHGAGARRVVAAEICRMSISSLGRKNFIAWPITSRNCRAETEPNSKTPTLKARETGRRRTSTSTERLMDDLLRDCRCRRRSRIAIDHLRTTTRAQTGDRFCLDHARMQHALHLLHCAADPWRRAQPLDCGNCARSARSRRARRERSHTCSGRS